MKLNIQVVFKNGNSLQGELTVEDFDAFCRDVASSKEKATIKSFDVGGEYKQIIMVDMDSVASMVISQVVEQKNESSADADMEDKSR